MTINLEYVKETTRKRLAFSAGELVPFGFVDLVAFHGKLREPTSNPGGSSCFNGTRAFADRGFRATHIIFVLTPVSTKRLIEVI